MTFNLASKIIINILFYNLIESFIKKLNYNRMALSPISQTTIKEVQINHAINIKTHIKNFHILIQPANFTENEEYLLKDILLKISATTIDYLRILLRKDFKLKYNYNNINIPVGSNYRKIVIALISTNDIKEEKYITLYIPIDFFRLFSKKINTDTESSTIEDETLAYFINPKWILPDLKSILTSLNNIELNKLINQLQRNKLLFPYQIFLIIHAYPELSVKLKRVLSKNIIKDVIEWKKMEKNLNIKKRDIVGGVYSVEEAIHFLIKNQADFNYSYFLNDIQKIVKTAINMEIILRKKFDEWIDEIIGNDLLYKTITVTNEIDIIGSISKEPAVYLEKFKTHISERKINDIKSMINNDISYDEQLSSRITFILNYRKLRIKKQNPGFESLEYLLKHFSRENDYNLLLQSVGWYTLATAFKGAKRIDVKRILKKLPVSCAFLIEDVIKGIVNPNILHDEMQINKAKKNCVDAIILLYDDGLIDLE